jgi:membrane protein
MPLTPRDALDLVKRSASSWLDDDAASIGAAIAFYTILSIAPTMLLVIGVASLFFGEEAASGALMNQLRDLVGDNGAMAMQGILASAEETSGSGLLPVVTGLAVLTIGATTVFMELQSGLNRIWRAVPRTGVTGYLRRRLIAFGVILGAGFLLTVSLLLSTAIALVGTLWSARIGGWEWLMQFFNLAIWFAITTGLFAMIYKVLPNRRIAWQDVWVGAAITSLLFALGKHLIGLYIGRAAVASSYGAAGAFVALIIWVYYSAQIFLLGAEFTYQYARSHGSLRDTQDAFAARAVARHAVPDPRR